MAARHWEQNKEATVYVGNLDERFSEPLMWELMTQAGPIVNVHMPMDRVSRLHMGFGFVEFDTPESADYAARCLNGVRLYGKPVRVNKASADRQRAADIGAELFVNSLDPQVDEKILYDTFAQFGRLVAAPTVVRDQNNVSKGYGFVSFDSFEASDAALAAMHGQYLLSRQISVEYAFKKDGKGERHGDDAERKLAAEGRKHNVVPDVQPLPPAFLMTRPPAAPTPATPAAPAAPPPAAATSANATPLPVNGHNMAAVAANGLAGPSPTGAYPPLRAPPPGYPQQQQLPPYAARPPPPGYGMGRGAGAAPPQGMPMAPPSGLPARPPPGGLGGLGGGPPPLQYRGGPPGAAGGGMMPPPGFSTGANNIPMAAGPPNGALGYPANGMPPPPGFGRR